MNLKLIMICFSVFLGLIFLLDIDVKIPRLRKPEKKIIYRPKTKVLKSVIRKVKVMLAITGSKITVKQYLELSILLFALGFSLGLFYNNFLISLTLAFGLPFAQFQLLKKKRNDLVRGHNEKLEIYMSMVTSSYIQSGDIESAIIESYKRMDQSNIESKSATKPFANFIGQAAGNADINECIINMKSDIDNKYFHQWCDKLALCRENSSLKPVLPYVINRMRRKRTLDTETVTNCHKHYREFIKISIICLVFTLFIPMMQPSWRYIVTNTALGKLLTAIVLIVVFIATAYVVKVNCPVGDKE